jgi:hypothetical protein
MSAKILSYARAQFQKLLAVSTKPSWRTRGLLAAANLTGLDFSIPTQQHNPQELIHAFEQIGSDSGAKTPQHGSAVSWFAHLDMVKFVVASGLTTAFIVEDDVDWDVQLLDQMRLISDNVRRFTECPDTDPNPFGSEWDVLWLGHCGERIENDKGRLLPYPDDTRCKTEFYSGWSKHFLRDNLPDGYRVVQKSVQTVCTFGYGITRNGAQKILELLGRGADEAYDVSMSHHCQKSNLQCITVNPQVMNHYEPAAGHGYLSPVHEGDGQGVLVDDSALEHTKGSTGNIMNSARCKALFNDVCMRPPSEI